MIPPWTKKRICRRCPSKHFLSSPGDFNMQPSLTDTAWRLSCFEFLCLSFSDRPSSLNGKQNGNRNKRRKYSREQKIAWFSKKEITEMIKGENLNYSFFYPSWQKAPFFFFLFKSACLEITRKTSRPCFSLALSASTRYSNPRNNCSSCYKTLLYFKSPSMNTY